MTVSCTPQDLNSSGHAATLNIYTCADKSYEDFTPLFAASSFWSNPNASVEVGVENTKEFLNAHGAAVEALRKAAPECILKIRQARFHRPNGRPYLPHLVRFICEPEIVSDYVYISDIDIITLDENILDAHLAYMQETGLPFSNVISKSDHLRLSGLHFTRYDAMYPLPPLDDLLKKFTGDETLLYAIVDRKIGGIPEQRRRFRPVHGIHVSPSRGPYLYRAPNNTIQPGWLGGFKGRHQRRWIVFRSSETFRAIENLLSPRIRGIVDEIDNFDPAQLLRNRSPRELEDLLYLRTGLTEL